MAFPTLNHIAVTVRDIEIADPGIAGFSAPTR
jgi:hypothetical protein